MLGKRHVMHFLSTAFLTLLFSYFGEVRQCIKDSYWMIRYPEPQETVWHAFFLYIRPCQTDRWRKFSSNTEWCRLEGILEGHAVQPPRKSKSNSKGLHRNLPSSEYLQEWRFHNSSGPLFQYLINFMLKKKKKLVKISHILIYVSSLLSNAHASDTTIPK